MTEKEVLELARVAGEWLFGANGSRRTTARASRFLWLPLSEIESILRGFDLLDAAGALTGEDRVLQEELIGLISGGNAPVIETPWTPSEPFGGRSLRLRPRPFSMRTRPPALQPRWRATHRALRSCSSS